MSRSETEPDPDDAAADDGEAADQLPRYRAGNESVQVEQHEMPGYDIYGPESAEVASVDRPDAQEETA